MEKIHYFSIFVLFFCCLAMVYGYNLGSIEYCAELKPQINLTISEITGRWFGAEVITHRESVEGDNAVGDCVEVVIGEFNEQMATSGPRPFNEMPRNFNPIGNRNFFLIPEYRSSQLPNFEVNAGTIEVVAVSRKYLVLKFCELRPREQLFTIILGREPNSLPLHVIREIRDKLRAFNLPTVYQRRVCNGMGAIILSHNLIILFFVVSIAWLKLI